MPTHTVRSLLASKAEAETIEFKAAFDPKENAQWCELLKDILAIGNTEGGAILFGLSDDGTPSRAEIAQILSLDLAVVSDKVYAYTGVYATGFEIVGGTRDGAALAILRIPMFPVPLIPTRPGTYALSNGKQQCAFSKGVLLVRHGPKSEPANTEDLSQIIRRRLRQDRRQWLAGLRRVVEAPPGSTLAIVAPSEAPVLPAPQVPALTSPTLSGAALVTSAPDAVPVRLSSEPSAPAIQLLDPDRSHPHTMTSVLRAINSLLAPHGITVGAYDIKVLGAVHGVFANLEFCYKSKRASRQYSPAFVDWLVSQLKRDRMFLKIARAKLHRINRSHR